MYWIGLTGNLGSGKSTVAEYLRKSGWPVVDADEVARSALAEDSPLIPALRKYFGSGVFDSDGKLDRKALGRRVFASKADLDWLESLVHPHVQDRVRQLKAELRSQGRTMAFYDVPLLFEKKLEGQFDKTVVVSAGREDIFKRVSERDELSRQEIEERLENQLSMEEKERRADYVIENSGTLGELEVAVSYFLEKLKTDLA